MSRSVHTFVLSLSVILSILILSGCGALEAFRSYTNVDGGQFTIAEEKEYSSAKYYKTFGKLGGFVGGYTNFVRQTNLAQIIADESGVGLDCSSLDSGQCLSLAENKFTDKYVRDSSNGQPQDTNGWIIRNIIQERLVMASNSACREFTQHLNTFQSSSNFLLGTAAVGAGAAGAIVTAATAARALAGSAGAISGARAELNADVFENKFVPVITRSIDDRRRTFLSALRGYEVPSGMRPLPESEIKSGSETQSSPPAAPSPTLSKAGADPFPGALPPSVVLSNPEPSLRDWSTYCPGTSNVVAGQNEMNAEYQLPPNGYQCLPLQRYPLEAAIADAIYFNDLCSLDKGLENIQVALDIAKHPGLDDLAAAQDLQNQLLQKQLAGIQIQQQIAAAEQKLAGSSSGVAQTGISLAGTRNFGVVKKFKDRTFTLTNNTASNLTVSAIAPFSASSGFSLQDQSCTANPILPSQSCSITIRFIRQNAGPASDTLTITAQPPVASVTLTANRK
jgi:hypothetical protein